MYKLSEMFDFSPEENGKNNIQENTQLERMKELNETYQKRGEFVKNKKEKEVDSIKLAEESERLKKLSKHRFLFKE